MDSSLRPVPSMPTLHPGALLARGGPILPDPFERPQTSFWHSARVALWQAIHALGLRPGDRVAVPAFCCGSELEPFLAAGIGLAPFELNEELDPDPSSFHGALRGAAAALVTHYFGFPAGLGPALALCRERGIPLIEDCAHALYARNGDESVGLAGEASVFSFWKTVALPDGGALHLSAGPWSGRARHPPAALVEKATRHLISRHMRSHPLRLVRFGERMRVRLRNGQPAEAEPEGIDRHDHDWELVRFHPEVADAAMSDRSDRLFRSTDHDAVRKARRRRYRQLESALARVPGLRPMFSSLREGACPLYFPVVVEDAAGLRRELARAAVGVKHIWPVFHPAIAWDLFPRERRWKELALGFPVHQSLRDGDIDRIVAAVTRWSRS